MMLSKLILLFALLFCLSAASMAAGRIHRSSDIQHGMKLTQLTGDELIKAACKGIGDNETECITALQAAPLDQKTDANRLTLYALRYVVDHADIVVAGIKQINSIGDIDPMLQSALSDCTEQYLSIDDLIETGISALEASNYPDAEQIVIAAVASIDVCDTQLKATGDDEKADDITGNTVDMAKDLKKDNLFHRNLLLAALNILTV